MDDAPTHLAAENSGWTSSEESESLGILGTGRRNFERRSRVSGEEGPGAEMVGLALLELGREGMSEGLDPEVRDPGREEELEIQTPLQKDTAVVLTEFRSERGLEDGASRTTLASFVDGLDALDRGGRRWGGEAVLLLGWGGVEEVSCSSPTQRI